MNPKVSIGARELNGNADNYTGTDGDYRAAYFALVSCSLIH